MLNFLLNLQTNLINLKSININNLKNYLIILIRIHFYFHQLIFKTLNN